jgi:predicted nucleic acid-binding protein
MRIYLDTSAFVKRYCDEEGSDVIEEVFEGDNEIITSYWTLAEAIAAIDKKVAKRQISEEERDFVISVLFSDVLNRITFEASDKALIRGAKEEGLSAFDVENREEREKLRRLLAN